MLFYEIVISLLDAQGRAVTPDASQAQDRTALFAGGNRQVRLCGRPCAYSKLVADRCTHTLPYAELTVARVSPWVNVSFSFPGLEKVKEDQVQESEDLVPRAGVCTPRAESNV